MYDARRDNLTREAHPPPSAGKSPVLMSKSETGGKKMKTRYFNTERKWICCYINSKGKEVSKIFDDIETGLKFIRLLDKRIGKGTCGGYIFTEASNV